MNRMFFIAAAAMVLGCSGGSSNGTNSEPQECVFSDTTYLLHFNQRNGGTCGLMADQTLVFKKNETISPSYDNPILFLLGTCEYESQHECEDKRVNCQYTLNNCNFRFSSDIQYLSDGSSGKGIITFSKECSNGHSCLSTYDTFSIKQ